MENQTDNQTQGVNYQWRGFWIGFVLGGIWLVLACITDTLPTFLTKYDVANILAPITVLSTGGTGLLIGWVLERLVNTATVICYAESLIEGLWTGLIFGFLSQFPLLLLYDLVPLTEWVRWALSLMTFVAVFLACTIWGIKKGRVVKMIFITACEYIKQMATTGKPQDNYIGQLNYGQARVRELARNIYRVAFRIRDGGHLYITVRIVGGQFFVTEFASKTGA